MFGRKSDWTEAADLNSSILAKDGKRESVK